MSWILVIIIGAIAGWIASRIMQRRSSGIIMNAILGIAGAIVGKWAFGFIGLHSSGALVGELTTAVIGAILILYVVRKLNIFD